MYDQGQPGMSPFNNGMTIRVTRLLFKDEGGYGDMYRRPYQAVMDHDATETLSEIIARSGRPTAPLYAPVASRIVAPSAQGEITNIVNGWGARRLRFTMFVEVQRMRATSHYVISGMTDFNGAMPKMSNGIIIGNGEITMDPNMTFYVNNLYQTRMAPVGAGGYDMDGYSSPGFVEKTQVLGADHGNGQGGFGNQRQFYSMLPHQVNAVLDGEMWARDPSSGTSPDFMNDLRYNVTMRPALGDRALTNPTAYVSKLISSVVATSTDGTLDVGGDLYGQAFAKAQATQSSLRNNPVLNAIGKLADGNPYSGSVFTYGDLLRLDENVDEIFTMVDSEMVRSHDGAMRSDYYNGSNTEDWGAASRIQQVAATINSSVSGIMMDFGAENFVFTADNSSIGGQMVVNPIRCIGLGGRIPPALVWNLCERLEAEVFYPVTYGNEVPFNGTFEIDLTGKTVLEFSFDNSPNTPFVAASFADSLFSPIVTTDPTTLRSMANQFESIVDDVLGYRDTGIGADVAAGHRLY